MSLIVAPLMALRHHTTIVQVEHNYAQRFSPRLLSAYIICLKCSLDIPSSSTSTSTTAVLDAYTLTLRTLRLSQPFSRLYARSRAAAEAKLIFLYLIRARVFLQPALSIPRYRYRR
ncbi:hypothetical protein, variant 3 [Exophiala oligosperma]|uniref:Uncharacterized protein n=1 Tax=Exophiala oligosperma TaxID=215243 RepID=A0A0D2BH08_9EURO|nr:uncharacterized protein PV06_11060 [Exophiala oligosperma]XP_016256988.1 hypothetical protein, variant 1 [Exophiala oligosperma]XP_016256989.1 hypothetical protein, variant 2 [Exophiala oligosperma]XP_016256990.1 hypothetical protein, variant 3 [Exophiala oligosperma]KIW36771.1 hypothetical protein PV06_11060 [Exophiala oligosperma]KIW36772.1 hypothetical protein, variant 1 [Exophiala oligosperma]KIW36773.1 hypothetical protein, variant 2 [Exophiala oligosperma]KIW36774.1 hypothetical pro